jgi:tetratricopeptide (TPR) repeat protein
MSSRVRHGAIPQNDTRHRALQLFLLALLLGCATPRPDPQLLFATAVKAHNDRQFTAAATGYERILRQYSEQENLCAQSLRSLASVRATQGQLDEAVKLYTRVAEKYPRQDWEILQAWKSAGDLLWDASRQDESRKYYQQIVSRFDQPDAAPVARLIVRAARARLPGAQ